MKKISLYIIIVVFIASCGSSKNNNTSQGDKSSYQEIAAAKLGESVTYSMNEDESFVLCISEKEGTAEQPRNIISYMVIKMKDNSTALENKFEGGSVKWSEKTEIEVFRTPGIMRDDQTHNDFVTVYNVETGKSRPKKNAVQD